MRTVLALLMTFILLGCESQYAQRRLAEIPVSPTLVLCENVLNFDPESQSRRWHNLRLETLSERAEDCSQYTHLQRELRPQQNINVRPTQNVNVDVNSN